MAATGSVPILSSTISGANRTEQEEQSQQRRRGYSPEVPGAWQTPRRWRSPDTGPLEHPAKHGADENTGVAAKFPRPVLRDAIKAEVVQPGT